MRGFFALTTLIGLLAATGNAASVPTAFARDDDDDNCSPAKGPLPTADFAYLRNITVSPHGEELITYWTNETSDASAEMAIVIIHGRYRDPENYFNISRNALISARANKVSGAVKNTLLIAPAFLSTKRNLGQYKTNQIAFGDCTEPNTWIDGSAASYPADTTVSSFSAINALLDTLADRSKFPNLSRIAFVGHGGGGQMATRYAVLGPIPVKSSTNIGTRFLIGDPSTNLYFTANRPTYDSFNTYNCTDCTKDQCPTYNQYKYGFTNIRTQVPILANDNRNQSDFFTKFVKRDVILIVGDKDTKYEGDQDCEAQIMGGVARRDRNLIYWRYINQLAGTSTSMDGIPGKFVAMPDWSLNVSSKINTQLVRVPNAKHDAQAVFSSSLGQQALFTWTL